MPPEPLQEVGLPLGVNLAGYLDATVGVGEAARHVATALERVGVAVARVGLSSRGAPRSRDGAPTRPPTHPITLVCANPDAMTGARDELGDAAFEGRHVIGMWWWEVAAVRGSWLRAFDLVDEVWAGSRFVADVFSAVAPVPVVHVPMPVPEPVISAASRETLGLPQHRFLFGLVYDYASVAARKNPLGLIDACRARLRRRRGRRPRAQDARRGPRARRACRGAGRRGPVPGRHGDRRAPADGGQERAHPRAGLLRLPAPLGGLRADDRRGDAARNAGDRVGLRRLARLRHRVQRTAGRRADGADRRRPRSLSGRGRVGRARPRPRRRLHARAVLADRSGAQARAQRARAEVVAHHHPAVAGRAMAERLARVMRLPLDGAGNSDALDLGAVRARMATGPKAAPGGERGARGAVREAALRAMRPYTVHQRLVDEEILRVLQTLDERVQGLAAGQQALAAELARLRDEQAEKE